MFMFAEIVVEVRQARSGAWRLIEAVGKGGAIHDVLHEGATREGAMAALADYRRHADIAPDMAVSLSRAGPHGTRMDFRDGRITVTGPEGEFVGSSAFVRLGWRHSRTIGAPDGALTAGSIGVEEGWREKGIAAAMHDFAAEACGIPSVPNLAHGTPGSLSELAQGFWAVRSGRQDVPGLGEAAARASFGRWGEIERDRDNWRSEKIHAPGAERDRCLAFALAVHRATGWPIVEASVRPGDETAWYVRMPDGGHMTSEGVWPPGQAVTDLDGRVYETSAVLAPVVVEGLEAAWFPEGAGAGLVGEAELWAGRLLVREGLYDPGPLPPDRDWTAIAEARFRKTVPVLAAAVLDGAMPVKPSVEAGRTRRA